MLDENLQFQEDEQLQAVQLSTSQLKDVLKNNYEFFIQFFMGELLKHAVPFFHLDIFSKIVTFAFERFALAVPRGHAKTTLVKLAVVYYFLFSHIRFIVYCSNTTTVAKDECRDIINFIESDNFIAVFGMVEWEKRNESDGIYIFKIGTKRCILRALGAGQQVRGLNIDNMRPELLICDDAEDDENTETEAQRTKFKRWVYGPLFKACARKAKKIWIGNLVSNHCLINQLCASDYWHSIKYGAILADGTPLWPDMWSIEALQEDYAIYQEAGMVAKWFAEMMNIPMPDGMGLIKSEEILYKPALTPGDFKYGFVTLDPALSKKTSADSSALVVHGMMEDWWQVAEHKRMRADPVTVLNAAIDLCIKWKLRIIGIESVAFQAVLLSLFKFIQVERGCYGIECVELYASGRKVERITGWAGYMKTGNYCLTEGEFEVTQELLNFDPAKKDNVDDVIDSCAYGPQMITEHLNLVMVDTETVLPVARSLFEISAV